MTITDEMVERALAAADYCTNADTRKWMHAALTAALEGREEPDATAAYMAGFERGKEAATAEERERCARVGRGWSSATTPWSRQGG